MYIRRSGVPRNHCATSAQTSHHHTIAYERDCSEHRCKGMYIRRAIGRRPGACRRSTPGHQQQLCAILTFQCRRSSKARGRSDCMRKQPGECSLPFGALCRTDSAFRRRIQPPRQSRGGAGNSRTQRRGRAYTTNITVWSVPPGDARNRSTVLLCNAHNTLWCRALLHCRRRSKRAVANIFRR